MKTTQKSAGSMATVALPFGLGGCSGMSQQDKNTAIGADAGGVIGHEIGK